MSIFTRIFTRAAPVAPVPTALDIYDVPAHKGFQVTTRHRSGITYRRTVATLDRARACLTESKALARAMGNDGARYSIRNLETGRFVAYRWHTVRA